MNFIKKDGTYYHYDTLSWHDDKVIGVCESPGILGSILIRKEKNILLPNADWLPKFIKQMWWWSDISCILSELYHHNHDIVSVLNSIDYETNDMLIHGTNKNIEKRVLQLAHSHGMYIDKDRYSNLILWGENNDSKN